MTLGTGVKSAQLWYGWLRALIFLKYIVEPAR